VRALDELTCDEEVRSRQWLTLGLACGIFVAALEATVVTAAMPQVVASLGGLSLYSWAFSLYMLAATVSLPFWGKLADIFGRRPFYLLGMGVFLLGSVLAGQARSMEQLIVFRGLQGLGAGAVQPLGLTIASDIYPLPERARKQALFSGVWGVATLLGPLIGGLVVEHLGWRWVFYLSLPFGVGAIVLIWRVPWGSVQPTRPRTFDLMGGLFFAGTTLTFLALMNGGRHLGLWGGLLLSGLGLIWAERSAKDPLFPPGVFGDRALRSALLVSFLTHIALFGSLAFISLFLQAVRGAPPTTAAGALVPIFAAWVIFSILASRLLLRTGFRMMIVLGAVLLTLGLAGLSQRHIPLSSALLLGSLVLMGAGMGISNVSLLLFVQHRVPWHERGMMTALLFLLRYLGGAVGTNLLGVVTQWRLHTLLEGVSPAEGDILRRQLDTLLRPSLQDGATPQILQTLRHLFGLAIQDGFGIAAVAAAVAILFCLPLPSTSSSPRDS